MADACIFDLDGQGADDEAAPFALPEGLRGPKSKRPGSRASNCSEVVGHSFTTQDLGPGLVGGGEGAGGEREVKGDGPLGVRGADGAKGQRRFGLGAGCAIWAGDGGPGHGGQWARWIRWGWMSAGRVGRWEFAVERAESRRAVGHSVMFGFPANQPLDTPIPCPLLPSPICLPGAPRSHKSPAPPHLPAPPGSLPLRSKPARELRSPSNGNSWQLREAWG